MDKKSLAVITLIAILATSNLYYQLSLGGFFYYEISAISANWGLLLFVILFIGSFLICNYLFSKFIDPLIQSKKKSRYITSTYKFVKISQYTVFAILAAITIQMVMTGQYSVGLFMAVAVISFSVAAFISVYLGIKFFAWYKSNHIFVILLCGISFILLTIGLAGVVVIVGGNVLIEKHPTSTIIPISKETSPEKRETDTAKESSLWNIIIMPSRVAFILYWIANVLLLRNYSEKIGRTKFWTIVSLPLVGFIIVNLIAVLSALVIGTSPFGLLFLTATRVVIVFVILLSGIFFAIMFLTTGRAMQRAGQPHIQDYLNCSAYGVIIFVLSLTIHLGTLLFPPTVLLPWALSGLAAFLVSFGFYSLAVSVSQDIKLRREIRNFVISESKLFKNIGEAEMTIGLEKQVDKIVKEQKDEMDKYTEIKPSLTEEDLKSYMSEVIREVKTSRNKK